MLRMDEMLRISVVREDTSTSRARCLLAFVTSSTSNSADALHSDGPSSGRPDDDHNVVARYLLSDVTLLRLSRSDVDTYFVDSVYVVAVFGHAFLRSDSQQDAAGLGFSHRVVKYVKRVSQRGRAPLELLAMSADEIDCMRSSGSES